MYENFIVFDNTGNLDTKEEEITEAFSSVRNMIRAYCENLIKEHLPNQEN
jgi:hypothetical protein